MLLYRRRGGAAALARRALQGAPAAVGNKQKKHRHCTMGLETCNREAEARDGRTNGRKREEKERPQELILMGATVPSPGSRAAPSPRFSAQPPGRFGFARRALPPPDGEPWESGQGSSIQKRSISCPRNLGHQQAFKRWS